MPTAKQLIFNPFVHRIIIRPSIYHLLFTSFAAQRFAAQTRVLTGTDRLFLNYGYEEDPPMAIPLDESDERDRFFIQQYHRTAAQVDLSGKKVLEISCGHGGGASYLARTLKPASYTGLDINPNAIEFARGRHSVPGLEFVQGDATALPFPDNSFDAVVNVEASHLYPDVPAFLSEVARVLAPGGHFLYTDFRRQRDLAAWEAEIAATPLRLVSRTDIGAEVLRGNVANLPVKEKMLDGHSALTKFAGEATDWSFNEALKTGEFRYLLFCLTKD